MEKFGIFELLDTLSALTQAKSTQSDAPPSHTADTDTRPKLSDNAFAPPPSPTEKDTPPLPNDGGTNTKKEGAFARLIANQEAISKRIDHQK